MATDFVFIDETGDGGLVGGSPHFGMALLQVSVDAYDAVRQLLASVRWSMSLFSEIKAGPARRPAQRILDGLTVLAEEGLLSASGLSLTKEHYGGRYLSWCELSVESTEWPLYLRHYLLRDLLEFHFQDRDRSGEIDLVMDRVSLSEPQRANLLAYLDSRASVPLRRQFAIPTIEHLTMADSRYVGGLQVAHVLAEVVKGVARGDSPTQEIASRLMNAASLIGQTQEGKKGRGPAIPNG